MRVPKYRKHPNGQAFVQHKSIDRPGNRLYLGIHGSEESRKRYHEFLARLESGDLADPTVQQNGLTIAMLIEKYAEHAESYYSDHREIHHLQTALRTLREHYGSERGSDFGPRKLKTLQSVWVEYGYARFTCNRYTGLIRRWAKWCVGEELLPPSVLQALTAVQPLRKGKTEAPETPSVVPVSPQTIRATLPFLSHVVAAMVRVQYICGMRPAEVCIMRPCDIRRDADGSQLPGGSDVWLYLPESHKNDWRNQALIKAVPPAAQSVLMRFWNREPNAYLFSPRDSYRNVPNRRGRRDIRDHYDTDSYRRSIKYGLKKARKNGVEIESWSPNRLRHAIYTLIRQRIGADAAQHWCGHATLDTGEYYFERQTDELKRIARLVDPLLELDPDREPK